MRRLINRWLRLNLNQKILITTVMLSVVLTLIISFITYSVLPNVYYGKKGDKLNYTIDTLKSDLQGEDLSEIKSELITFSEYYQGCVRLVSPDDKTVYEKTKLESKELAFAEVKRLRESISVHRDLYVKGVEEPYKLTLILFVNPNMDLKKILIYIIPLTILVIAGLSILGMLIFSKLITRPLMYAIKNEHNQIKQKKEFVAAVSHDLKTPITIISGQLEGMIYNVGKYKDRDLYLQKCYEHTQELKALVERLMEISKKDLIEKDIHKSEIDLKNLINTTLKKHRYLYEEKQITIKTRFKNKYQIYANIDDMKTVLNNLISNAILYSPKQGSIAITLEDDTSKLINPIIRLTVENTGVALTDEQLEKVFEPLYRVEGSRNKHTGGSGLGLYFVGQILSDHGFMYKMFSKENSTVFRIEFSPYNI